MLAVLIPPDSNWQTDQHTRLTLL